MDFFGIKTFNEYHNPLMPWWKVRKIFKRPKCHFIYGKNIWFFGMYARRDYYNPIIHINSSALGWKWKYDMVRHEWDPYINITFFRKWHLIWIFNWCDKKDEQSKTRSMATWEAILDYLYNNKTLEECINSHIWSKVEGESEDITIHKNIREKCLKTLNL